jgi:hypothetical protein
MKLMSKAFLFFNALLFLLMACDNSTAPEITELDQAMQRWEQVGPSDYEYDLNRFCFCIPLSGTVVVRADTLNTVLDKETREPLTVVLNDEQVPVLEAYPDLFFTIDGFFDYIIEQKQRTDEVELTFSADFGYPSEVVIDRSQMPVDGGISFEIEDLRRL